MIKTIYALRAKMSAMEGLTAHDVYFNISSVYKTPIQISAITYPQAYSEDGYG